MSEFKLSSEQQEIVDAGNISLLVSASAGSGKTSVMLSRILKLLIDKKTTIDRILALTFTNASAADMKKKLYERLLKESEKNKNCADALLALGTSDICTIDSFCQKLVKTYFYLAGVDPSFLLIDDVNAALLKEKALDRLIVKMYEKNNTDFEDVLFSNFEGRNYKKIKDLILTIYKHLCVTSDKSMLSKKTMLSYLQNLNENAAAKIILENAINALNDVYDLFNDRKKTALPEEKEYLSNILITLEKSDYAKFSFEKMCEFIKMFEIPNVLKKNFKNAEDFDVFCDDLKEIVSSAKAILKPVREQFTEKNIEEIKNTLKASSKNAEFFLMLGCKFKEEYDALKKEKNFLDFDDIKEKAFEILRNAEIQAEMKKKYNYVFVDEFQDVNSLQHEIISVAGSGGSSFAVGDVKQSIYAFRLSNPKIFNELFSMLEKGDKNAKAKLLNQNFRSTGEILSFVNAIFKVIMTKRTSQIDYEKNNMFFWDEKNRQTGDKCEVILINNNSDAKIVLPKIYSVLNHNFETAEKQLALSEGFEIFQIISKCIKNGYKEEDITILSRNKTAYLKDVCFYLKKFGISLNVNFADDLTKTKETAVLHSLLRLANNCYSDIDLTAVMLSPLFNFDADELVKIKKDYSHERFFHRCVYSYAADKKDELAIKINYLKNYVKEIITNSQTMSVFELAKKIIFDFDYKILLNKNDDDNEYENVERYLLALKKLGGSSLFEYVTLTEKSGLTFKVEVKSIQNGKVNVNTIHGSKGLEYKVVILAGAGRPFNTESLKNEVIVTEELGVGVKAANALENKKEDTLAKLAGKLITKKECFAEEIRLLYVALTRACEKLYVVGDVKVDKIKSTKTDADVLCHDNFIKLILSGLKDENIKQLKDDGVTYIKNGKKEIAEFLIKNKSDILAVAEKKITRQAFFETAGYENVMQKIKNDLNKEISPSEKLMQKQSVSKLAKSENEFEMFKGVSLDEDEREQRIMSGNAYHRFFEKFNVFADDLNKEKERAFLSLTKAEQMVIEKRHLDAFLKSELIDILKSGRLLKEQKFVYIKQSQGAKVLIQGIIDALIIKDGEIIVIDYKTTNASDDEIIKRYATQLKIYSKAACEIVGISTKKMLIYNVYKAKLIEIFD